MASYPDNTEACGVPGPSQSTLRVQYQEEHGIMPDSEYDLLVHYWEGNPPPMGKGNGQSWTDTIDPSLLKQQDDQQHQHQHQQHQHEGDDGPSKLIQRRPDLAPFVGSAGPEIYGGGYYAPQPGFAHGYVPAQSVMPIAPSQLAEHPFNPAAAGPMYGDASVGGAAPFHGYGGPYVGSAAPVDNYGVPSVGDAGTVHGDAGPVHGYGGAYVGGAAPAQAHGFPPVGGAAPVHGYGIPTVGVAAPVQDNGAHAMVTLPTPAEDDPFVTSTSNSTSADSPATSTASSVQVANIPAPTFALAPAPAPAPPQQAPQQARRTARNTWTQAEKDLVVHLRENKGMDWPDIRQILGTHTPKSIGDKYWQIVRLRRGLPR